MNGSREGRKFVKHNTEGKIGCHDGANGERWSPQTLKIELSDFYIIIINVIYRKQSYKNQGGRRLCLWE